MQPRQDFGGAAYLPLLLRSPQEVGRRAAAAAPSSCSPWVITGGTGALGSLTGHWMAMEMKKPILLLGRTGRLPSTSTAAWLASLDLAVLQG